jgi:hypothetical protein
MNELPLTKEAKALKDSILAIPRTLEALTDTLPEGIDHDNLTRLHHLAASGSPLAVPEIRRELAHFPKFPILLNYLRIAHLVRNENRKAETVLKKLAEEHPDYLFTRLELANQALAKNQPEKVAEQLGYNLNIRELYPERQVFHIAELCQYYYQVAVTLARTGQQALARGVKAALAEICYDEKIDAIITNEVMTANLRHAQKRFEEDDKRRVRVVPHPLPNKIITTEKPSFQHEVISELYLFFTDLPESTIRAILELPRESLLQDLATVLEDCFARTPNFMGDHVKDQLPFAAFHTIHLLAEINGRELCSDVLRFLELHPKALEYWFDLEFSFKTQLPRIIDGNLPSCFAWLKLPGIDNRSKGMITEAMGQLGQTNPELIKEITDGLADVLAFVIDSPPEDNILDTCFIYHLISDLTDLRAADKLPVIRRTYEKDLVETLLVGGLECIEDDIVKQITPPWEWLPILEQYAAYPEDEDVEEIDDVAYVGNTNVVPPPRQQPIFAGLSANSVPAPAPNPKNAPIPYFPNTMGRNDPCPCGSGKKYKKCCLM